MSGSFRSVVLGVSSEDVNRCVYLNPVSRVLNGLAHLKDQTRITKKRCTYLTNARSIFELNFQTFKSSVVVFQVGTSQVTATAACGALSHSSG